MKFDVCVMNPPYCRNFHLKVLDYIMKFAKHMCSIQHCLWLTSPVNFYNKKSFYYKYESIRKHLNRIICFDQWQMTNTFEQNAFFSSELGIYVIDEQTHNYEMRIDPILKKIIDKLKKDDNFSKLDIRKYDDALDNYLCLSAFAPGLKYGKPVTKSVKQIGVCTKNDTYRQKKAKIKCATVGDVRNTNCIVFKTFEEAQNCYDSMQTPIAHYVCAKTTLSLNMHNDFLMWMPDYKEKWSEEKLADYFKLTDDEVFKINEEVKMLKFDM